MKDCMEAGILSLILSFYTLAVLSIVTAWRWLYNFHRIGLLVAVLLMTPYVVRAVVTYLW